MFAASIKQGLRGSAFSTGLIFLVLMIASFFYPKSPDQNVFPDLFYNFFSSQIRSPWIIVLFNLGSILCALILIGALISSHELSDKMNFFSVFLYTFWASISIHAETVSKALLINCLLLFALYKLLTVYRKEDCLSDLFLATFCLSTTLFLSIASFIYVPVFFIALTILKPLNVREFIISLVGLLCPVFIFECLAYLSNFQQWYLIEAIKVYFSNFHLPVLNLFEWLLTGFIFVLIALSLFHSFLVPHSTKVKTAKGKSILWWWLIGAVLVAFSSSSDYSGVLCTLLIPIVFISGDYLFYLRRLLFTNILLTLLLISGFLIVLNNFGIFLVH